MKKKLKKHSKLSLILSVLTIIIMITSYLIPKILAGDTVVSDIYMSGEVNQNRISLTIIDENIEDEKLVVPIPDGVTYSENSSPNVAITEDSLNNQLVIDWIEGEMKQAQIEFDVSKSGIYTFTANTVRGEEPVSSEPIEIDVLVPDALDDTLLSENSSSENESNVLEQNEDTPGRINDDDIEESSSQPQESSPDGVVGVFGDDYANYFKTNGSASISGDIGTLTPMQPFLVGNTVLQTKFDPNQSFYLKGNINLGSRNHIEQGGDGISVAFHPGEVDQIGGAGNAMGIGGLQGAFGFKLDTAFNDADDDISTADPVRFATMDNGKPAAFGSFVDGIDGRAKTIDSTAQMITRPQNNTFKYFTLSYYPSIRNMTIYYDGLSWEIDTTPFIDHKKTYSFSINASTGLHMNLQQFQLSSLIYTEAEGKVNVEYVSTDGKSLDYNQLSGVLGSQYVTEQKSFTGYTFKEVQGNTTGIFKEETQNVKYIYTKNPIPGGDVTVKYLDTLGNKISDDIILTGNVGEQYSTTQKDVQGYKFLKVEGDTQGQFTPSPKEVKYIYEPRALSFYSVPHELSFKDEKISSTTKRIQRKDPGWKIVVKDNRENKGGWKISATLIEQFKDTSGNEVGDNILLYSKNGSKDEWIETNTIVFNGESTEEKELYDVSWAENEGPLLQVPPGLVKADQYKSVIEWSLLDTPV